MKLKLAQLAVLGLLDLVLICAGLGVFAPALVSMKDTVAVLTGVIVVLATATAVIGIALKIVSIIKSMEHQKNA